MHHMTMNFATLFSGGGNPKELAKEEGTLVVFAMV